MEWRHNLVSGAASNGMGTAITPARSGAYCLWLKDWAKRETYRIGFDGGGNILGAFSALDTLYDALLPHGNGYVLVFSHQGETVVSGRSHEHVELWSHRTERAAPDGWRLAESDGGTLYLLYEHINPHDAHREARLAVVDAAGPRVMEHKHTFTDAEFRRSQALAVMPDRIGVCLRNRGAHVVSYILNAEDGGLHSSSSFRAHPHSKWSVPLCLLPLQSGEFLLAGYHEEDPGLRRPWVCRFDADFGALAGFSVPAPHAEQAVTALAAMPDGSILALCPPWTVYRLSGKGFITHSWAVPERSRDNALSALFPCPDGGCFITGRSFTRDKHPATWLAKLADNDFTEA